jgi:hypothetical protein
MYQDNAAPVHYVKYAERRVRHITALASLKQETRLGYKRTNG